MAVKDEGVVSQKEYEKASTNKYSAFVEEVMKEIDEKSDVDPSADGLKIYTTLDTKAQDKLDELMDGDTVGFTEGMQGGVTLLDTKTGEVRAIGAGRDSTVGGYNYATQAQRQPGSTIKPILDYGPVIENKNGQLTSKLMTQLTLIQMEHLFETLTVPIKGSCLCVKPSPNHVTSRL